MNVVKWSIFSRLMTGYLVLLALVTGVSVYAVRQLNSVREVTESIITVDNHLLDLHKKLSDALLSEQRHEKKFIILRDPAFLQGFRESNEEFTGHLREAGETAGRGEPAAVLKRIRQLHGQYERLFADEARSVSAGRAYAAGRFRSRKDEVLNDLTGELARLKVVSQQGIVYKVQELAVAGSRATRAVTGAAAAAVVIGVVFSVLITTGITQPLKKMRRKMAEFSSGMRSVDLRINSPPEVAALGRSFNFMCRKLNELDSLKNDFYSLMSHELRTPLCTIRESTNLLSEGVGGSVTEKQQRLLAIMGEEIDRLIRLVNSLLDISRLEAGMVSYRISDTDLNPLIAQAVSEIAPLAASRGITIDQQLGQLPLLAVDAERMLQVLRNLLGNALKFTPRGGRIAISSDSREKLARVSISDTGPGIAQEDRAFIFEKYRQGAGGARGGGGSGLGLAIVRQVIQDHGGSVWVESELGQGSTFIFVLPH